MLRLPTTTTLSMACLKRSCRRNLPLRVSFIHQITKTLTGGVSHSFRGLCRKGAAPTAQRHTAFEGGDKDGDSFNIAMKLPESSDVLFES